MCTIVASLSQNGTSYHCADQSPIQQDKRTGKVAVVQLLFKKLQVNIIRHWLQSVSTILGSVLNFISLRFYRCLFFFFKNNTWCNCSACSCSLTSLTATSLASPKIVWDFSQRRSGWVWSSVSCWFSSCRAVSVCSPTSTPWIASTTPKESPYKSTWPSSGWQRLAVLHENQWKFSSMD